MPTDKDPDELPDDLKRELEELLIEELEFELMKLGFTREQLDARRKEAAEQPPKPTVN